MRVGIVATAGVLLLAGGSPVGAGSTIQIQASPHMSFAPATLRIRATVTPDADNRALAIVAQSEGFFRSSEVPLEGDKGPRTIFLEYRNVPGGTYDIQGVLVGSRGQVATAHSSVTVLSVDSQ